MKMKNITELDKIILEIDLSANRHFSSASMEKLTEAINMARKYNDGSYKVFLKGLELLSNRFSRKSEDECLRHFVSASTLNPNNDIFKLFIGIIYRIQGKIPKAIEYFEELLVNNPNNVDARVEMAICHGLLQNYMQAIEFFEIALELAPKNKKALRKI